MLRKKLEQWSEWARDGLVLIVTECRFDRFFIVLLVFSSSSPLPIYTMEAYRYCRWALGFR